MRAVRVTRLEGPAAVTVEEVPEPDAEGPNGSQVLVEVHAVGVAFPDLLLSKGEYQLKPELPFTLGVDVAGVAAVGVYGGAAEVAAFGADSVFALPDSMSFDQGAALPMNYLTAHFVLKERGRLEPGETVLINGAAGGVGTATIQVARGMGARTIAVVSTPEKAEVARAAGADETVLVDDFLAAVKELTGGRGVDMVVDVVGGDSFTDYLRSLAETGRVMVVGFTSDEGIPQVKVNRLLLNNLDVRGAGWGAYAMAKPGYLRRQWADLVPLMDSGAIAPPIGATYAFEDFGRALVEMDERRTLGKSIVRVVGA